MGTAFVSQLDPCRPRQQRENDRLILSLLWGGRFFCIGVAVKHPLLLTIVALRVSIAALILAPLTGLTMPRSREMWIVFASLGLINNMVPFCLIARGQTIWPAGWRPY